MKRAAQRRDLRSLYEAVPHLTFEDAAALLAHLARNPLFLAADVLPHLAELKTGPGPYVAASYGSREATACLEIFVWPVGAATPIHDHTSWGVYQCVSGTLLEDRYTRLDDGSQPEAAHLRRRWHRAWAPADGVSTVGAYEEGIHRIANATSRLAVSVHLYGPRAGAFDGRDYDPTRDFVCDRLEFAQAPSAALAALG